MLLLSQTDGQWPPLHKEIYANSVGARIARPFRNKCNFYPKRTVRVAKRREDLKKQHGVLFFSERDRTAVRPSPPTVCMSITLFAVGADSISARLVFREHMECSPTVFKSKILFACSRIVTVLIAYCCRGRRPRRPVTKQKLHSFRNGRAMRAPTVFA